MADQIFPLSPIAARATQPSDEDYDAIREAFMETSRGRWFLTEYTKRNRNADTALVLDAVARLESSLAAQKQQAPQPEPQQADRSPEVIAAVTALLAQSRIEADALLPAQPAPAEDSPALKGVRVLREMAWALRESGSDGRIPDLLLKQAHAIEEGLKASGGQELRDRLLSIFDALARDIGSLAGEARIEPQHTGAEGGAASTSDQMPPAEAAADSPASVGPAPAEAFAELDDTLALLSDEFGKHQPDDVAWHEPALVISEPEALACNPGPEPETPPMPLTAKVVPMTLPTPIVTPEPVASLGAALLETGVVTKTDAVRSDPLAPFKRMTQAERIAFFS